MIKTIQGAGIDVNAIGDGTLEADITGVSISKTAMPVGAATYVQISVNHDAFVAQIDEAKYDIPAGVKKPINEAAVATFTTYYCYYKLESGVMVWHASLTHPDLETPEVEDYVWVREVRIKAVGVDPAASTVAIEYVVRHSVTHDDFCHQVSDACYLQPPIYVSGFAPTIDGTTGAISIGAGQYDRLTGGVRAYTGCTDGLINSPNGAEVVANLELITKYADGSAISPNKYVKCLLGVYVNELSDYNILCNPQGVAAPEYTTMEEAWADSQNVAATGFSSTRKHAILPLAWVVFKVGTWVATGGMRDIRETGMVLASGASAGTTSHSALNNLDVLADHSLYLAVDGSRTLTGDMLVTAGKKIDGVDISAHAADTEAHHATVTLAASATPILGLAGQAVSFDTQVTKTVLAGPASGADTAPTFRQLAAADISDFDAAALLAAPAVTLAASATGLMDLTGQAISLDSQSASTVLAGPVVGASATTPAFRQLNIQDIARPSGVLTLANDVNNNVTLTAGTRLYSITGPTGSFSITGFTGGTDGAVLYLYNNVAQNLTITSQGGTSTDVNRIIVLNNTNSTVSVGFFTFVYFAGTINRWILTSVSA